MLSLASFPPDRREIERWFADHPRQWEAGYACRFAVMLEGEMVGLVDVDGIGQGEGTLGYWLDHAVWGRGYAFEAANAVTRFALGDIGLSKLKAGHAYDNPASGRILTKLGFRRLDIVDLFIPAAKQMDLAESICKTLRVNRRLSWVNRYRSFAAELGARSALARL